MDVHAVSFDVFGTLLSVAEPIGSTYAAALTVVSGSEASAETVESRFREGFRTVTAQPDGRQLDEAAWRRIVETTFTGLCPPGSMEELFQRLWQHYSQAGAFHLLPGVISGLDKLKGQGLSLAVISNNDSRTHGVLEGLGLRDYFDFVLLSAESGSAKPEVGMFREAERRLGLEPQAMLHVGDLLDEDVAGAQAAGWHVAWLGPETDGPEGVEAISNIEELADRLAS
ncbi:MAG: HAD-IA family hydrolase [Verrucomicrobiota bacterium]